MTAIGLVLCYFGIYAPVLRMSEGTQEIKLSTLMPLIGPIFLLGGLGLLLATGISHRRGADFSENQFQKNPLHRWIVIAAMLCGLVTAIYARLVFLPMMQVKYGYLG